MSLQSELTRLQANVTSISSSKDAIMTALASKGVTVPSGATLHDVPMLIGQINGMGPIGYVAIGGRTYKTVKIGTQEWLAENLDYKFDVNGSQIPIGVNGDPATPAAWYYNNDEATYGVNGNKYGLLYDWAAMKYLENNKSTLLPDGWRIPTTTEWDALATSVGGSSTAGTKLKSTTGWSSGNGDGSYDFNAFPAGSRYSGSFSLLGSYAYFWAFSTSLSSYFQRSFNTSASMNSGYGELPSISCYSIRLVKDIT